MDNDSTAIIELPQRNDLSIQLTDRALQAMSEQRAELKKFIVAQLREGLDGDYAVIPGTPKKALLKPGAEKLANLFQIGSKIATVDKEIDLKGGFVMFSYTIELFHIPSGRPVGQCQGSANCLEKKFKNQDPASAINTLQKMAQKRAFVGAVITAVGASDFFTQDLEDMDPLPKAAPRSVSVTPGVTGAHSGHMADEAPPCPQCQKKMMLSKYPNKQTGTIDWYCVSCRLSQPRN